MTEREQFNIVGHVRTLPGFPIFQMRTWLSKEEYVLEYWSVN
jgi:hypothetical protein